MVDPSGTTGVPPVGNAVREEKNSMLEAGLDRLSGLAEVLGGGGA